MSEHQLTGKASIDRPWMQYYPPQLIEGLTVQQCTLWEYLKANCPGEDVTAIHYYGKNITWKEVFQTATAAARSLRVMGIGEGDQIPMYIKAVPEYIYMLLAAEKVGASLVCRDNTLDENIEASRKAGAKTIFVHDFMPHSDFNKFRKNSQVTQAVLIPTVDRRALGRLPKHISNYIDAQYPDFPVYGPQTMTWAQFLELGRWHTGAVDAVRNIHRPLLRCYTSGSTGPSKQVIHSAYSMIGNMHQINFYGSQDQFRPTWLVTHLPPALVAVVVSMLLLPLASNKLLILDPFVAPEDVDLELMRYRPNCWPLVPMFIEIIMRSKRIPEDYDMSHLMNSGAGAEAFSNNQFKRVHEFLAKHNCHIRFTNGYGSSEAGSNMTLAMSKYPLGNGNVGIPIPLSIMSVFEPETSRELGYNEYGEICITGPGNMLGYDNPKTTSRALWKHEDGHTWLHTGDLGYIKEDGTIFVLNRGKSLRYGGSDLAVQPMENELSDLNIEGVKDEFYVLTPDERHRGYYEPYLFVVLEEGYKLEDVEREIRAKVCDNSQPVEIFELKARPFFHFKTSRLILADMIRKGETDFSAV